MRGLLDGCSKSGARFVFADNLYLYGPLSRPLTEDIPLTNFGRKPAVRATITRLWQAAHEEKRVRAVAVRASDFYGPDSSTSVISAFGVARLVAGKPAIMPYPTDQPHDFTYVPDFARALVSLIDAPEGAYGQAWHVPNAPNRTLRDVLMRAADLAGKSARCAFSGIGRTSSIPRNLPTPSDATRRRSTTASRPQSASIPRYTTNRWGKRERRSARRKGA
jgi:nucleoside-diphosphate-sugar epimerase